MTIALHEPQRSWLDLQNPALELANTIAGTDFVPQHFRNNPAAITAAILYGDEVGLGPMQSLAKIAVINGRPTLAAEAMRALILQAGHELWIEDSTNTRCTVAGRRRDSEQTSRITWTMDDAKRAGLAGKQSWRSYPRQMLQARASAELARAIFPDAIGGLDATEEFSDVEPQNGQVIETTPSAPTRKRRRAAISQSSSASPDAPGEPEPPPLPGEEPDEPPAEPEPQPMLPPKPAPMPGKPMIEPKQRNRLMQLFGQQGFNEREHRLAFSSALIKRRISSSNDLTQEEADRLINALETHEPSEPPSQGELPEDF